MSLVDLPPVPYKAKMVTDDGVPAQIWATWFRQLFNRVGGNVSSEFSTKTASYALSESDSSIIFSGLSGNVVATLPAANGASGGFLIINSDPTYSVTINTTSAQTVGGRASASIVLSAGCGDFIEVDTDGSNWQLVGKKETKVLTSSGSGSYGASLSGVYLSGSPSLTLTPGQWRITGEIGLISATGLAGQYYDINTGSGFYAATGTGSGSAPTALSGSPLGYTTVQQTVQGVANGTGGGGVQSTVHPFIYSVTANTTIYLVAQTTTPAGATGTWNNSIVAERVW